MTTYVGIDVHSSFSQVAIVPLSIMQEKGRAWEAGTQQRITNTREDFDRLLSLLKEHTGVSIAIDHTGGHYSAPLVHLLVNAGYTLCYLHPGGLRNFKKGKAEFNKTDKIDAVYMARALYYHETHGDDYHFSMLNPKLGTEAELLRIIITQRQMLKRLQTQTANRLHQLFISTFPEGEATCFDQLLEVLISYRSIKEILEAKKLEVKGVHKHKLDEIKKLAAITIGISSGPYNEAIWYLVMQHKDMEVKIAGLDKRMIELLDDHPYSKILMSFPCLGKVAAATLIASIGDINYYSSYQKLRKELGVAPRIAQSGNSKGISKLAPGNKDAKRVLFQAVFAQLTPKAPATDFRDYYKKKKAEGMHGTKAIVATMGQLTEVIYHCLKTGELYEYQGGKHESTGVPSIQ